MGTVSQLRPGLVFSALVAVFAVQVLWQGQPTPLLIGGHLALLADPQGVSRATYAELSTALGIHRRTLDTHIPAMLSTNLFVRDGATWIYRWDTVRACQLAVTHAQYSKAAFCAGTFVLLLPAAHTG